MPKVMLDAGHYGSRNQSPVYPQYYEAKQMWKLHLYLKEHLENFGFDVLLTRSNQAADMSVTARGSLAKGCDLFLSLHSDASDSATVNRATVFYAYDDLNSASVLAKQIAHAVGLCMGVSGNIKTRQGNNGDYYGVMRGARSAGCPLYYIIEHSFHTCKASAEWLMSDSHLDKLAKAEAEVIAAYYGLKKEETEKTETTNKGASTVNIELTVLKNGSKGEEVKTLQRILNALGYKGKNGKVLTVDGIFGANCEFAVKNFQMKESLSADGIVGKNTWNKLLRG
jgi:N-acetylmuramoyl-L-alanine amidase